MQINLKVHFHELLMLKHGRKPKESVVLVCSCFETKTVSLCTWTTEYTSKEQL